MDNKRLTEDQISKAAEWWADQVCAPTFDNGDQSPAGAFTMALAMMNTEAVTDDRRQAFVDALSAKLHEVNAGSFFVLGVDYSPDPILADAAREAGVNPGNFPWKTTMWFYDDGSVKVSKGYRAPAVEI